VNSDLVIDLILLTLVTSFAFALTYHPYFWGDELIMHRLAIQHNYSFWPIFEQINTYKPRLVSNGLVTLLVEWEMERWVTAALQVGCVVWINALLYGVVRYLFGGDRLLAWLLIATVVTSRYGIVFYFDYSSGFLDLLSTALLLTALLVAWLAWRDDFRASYAAMALVAAVLCGFAHERYIAGLLAAGFAIAIAEWVGKRRRPVIGWALSLGVVPLLSFWIANAALGTLPMTTGTAGQVVEFGSDTLWTVLAYSYNVFLGGNYGSSHLWGGYNHLQPEGVIMGLVTAVATVVVITMIVLRKAVAWQHRWLAAVLLAVAAAMIAVASLPGSAFIQARWMFPVGILLALTWVIAVKGAWRHVAIAVILAANLLYLSGSQDSLAQVSSSRSVDSLATSLLGVTPGKSGIIVGSGGEGWVIGGCCAVGVGPRTGDTFSKVSLKYVIRIDPFIAGHVFDPAQYDFGLAYDTMTPDQTARYRLVSVSEAFTIAGIPGDGTPKVESKGQ
jgi:hypothetical protein